MGPKTLKEIREDIRKAIAAETGEDPIAWLERRMSAPLKPKPGVLRELDVFASMHRLLKAPSKKQTTRKRAKAKR